MPIGQFAEKAEELLDEGYKGCNITLPFKLDAYKFADKLTEGARSCGAVNTLVFGNKILGDNTDGIGFVTDITSRFGFNITNASILVLGAGGGVRGLLPSLLEQNPKWIAVANRTLERAQTLADVFGVDAIPYEATAAEHFDLVINATSPTSRPRFPNRCSPKCPSPMTSSTVRNPLLSWSLRRKAARRKWLTASAC